MHARVRARRLLLPLALLAAWFAVDIRAGKAIDYPPIPSQPIDMNRDGEADFYLDRFLYLNNIPTWVRQETLRLGTYDPYQSFEERLQSPNGNSALVEAGQLALLSPGDLVDGAAAAGRQWVDAFDPVYISEDNTFNGPPGGWEGIWGAAGGGIAGVRIPADDGLHYGWIKLRVENWEENTPNGFREHGPTAIDWYLESRPDTPVVVGAVPEPETWILALIFVASVAAWKFAKRMLPFLICLLVPVAANGEIVHRINDRSGANIDGDALDLNEDGMIDFRINEYGYITTSISSSSAYIFSLSGPGPGRSSPHSNGVLSGDAGVAPLTLGTSIDAASSTWVDSFSELPIISHWFDGGSRESGWTGPWADQIAGFIGIRFDLSDGLHYGWIRLSIEHPTGDGLVGKNPRVLDWVYESTPNAPIVAGTVPEPASVALALVGGIAAVTWRLRKKSRRAA
ncbi:MAG: PEP-CTERM sorting domain-containing protein [Pirellulales bacterium]